MRDQNKALILLTGCAGHAGQGIAEVLSTAYRVRGLDVKPCVGSHEMVVGSVADIEICRRAMAVEGFVVGQPEYLDTKPTMEILGWAPRHRFEALRRAAGG